MIVRVAILGLALSGVLGFPTAPKSTPDPSAEPNVNDPMKTLGVEELKTRIKVLVEQTDVGDVTTTSDRAKRADSQCTSCADGQCDCANGLCNCDEGCQRGKPPGDDGLPRIILNQRSIDESLESEDAKDEVERGHVNTQLEDASTKKQVSLEDGGSNERKVAEKEQPSTPAPLAREDIIKQDMEPQGLVQPDEHPISSSKSELPDDWDDNIPKVIDTRVKKDVEGSTRRGGASTDNPQSVASDVTNGGTDKSMYRLGVDLARNNRDVEHSVNSTEVSAKAEIATDNNNANKPEVRAERNVQTTVENHDVTISSVKAADDSSTTVTKEKTAVTSEGPGVSTANDVSQYVAQRAQRNSNETTEVKSAVGDVLEVSTTEKTSEQPRISALAEMILENGSPRAKRDLTSSAKASERPQVRETSAASAADQTVGSDIENIAATKEDSTDKAGAPKARAKKGIDDSSANSYVTEEPLTSTHGKTAETANIPESTSSRAARVKRDDQTSVGQVKEESTVAATSAGGLSTSQIASETQGPTQDTTSSAEQVNELTSSQTSMSTEVSHADLEGKLDSSAASGGNAASTSSLDASSGTTKESGSLKKVKQVLEEHKPSTKPSTLTQTRQIKISSGKEVSTSKKTAEVDKDHKAGKQIRESPSQDHSENLKTAETTQANTVIKGISQKEESKATSTSKEQDRANAPTVAEPVGDEAKQNLRSRLESSWGSNSHQDSDGWQQERRLGGNWQVDGSGTPNFNDLDIRHLGGNDLPIPPVDGKHPSASSDKPAQSGSVEFQDKSSGVYNMASLAILLTTSIFAVFGL